MQLLLTLEERKVITRALEKCLAQAQGTAVARKREIANRLLDRVLDPILRFDADELEDLSASLSSCKVELKNRIAAELDAAAKNLLIEQRKLLEHAADKVTEACMMA
jgi:D-serine dehydratase